MTTKPVRKALNMHDLLGTHELDNQFEALQREIKNLKNRIDQAFQNRDTKFLSNYVDNPSAYPMSNNNGDEKLDIPEEPGANWRLHRKLTGHSNKIYAIRWCPNYEEQKWNLVSASQDGNLVVWNVCNGSKQVGIPLKIAWVMTCGYSPNGQYVASGGLDNLCSVFNIQDSMGWGASMPCTELQQHEGYVSCCRFVNDEQIMTASGDASCILWDIDTQSEIASFAEHDRDVQSVAMMNPDYKNENANSNRNIFVSGSSDSTAKVWDIRENGTSIATFKGHVSDINSVQWFPDGQPNTFASGSDDASVRLFDMKAFREINIYAYDQMFDAVCCVDFSMSGYYLIAGYDEEPYCLVWNTLHATRVKTLEHPKRASCLQVSPNGYCVATGSWDKNVRIWA